MRAPVTVGPAKREDLTVDAGLVEPIGRLGDYAWIDADKNGTYVVCFERASLPSAYADHQLTEPSAGDGTNDSHADLVTWCAKPVEPAPTEGWQVRAMRRAGSELDSALRLLVDLAADRPENPRLLRRSTARWLRSDAVDGVVVDVLEEPAAGESRLRYWVDADGRLRRVEARLGGRRDYAVFDFRGGGTAITPIPPLG